MKKQIHLFYCLLLINIAALQAQQWSSSTASLGLLPDGYTVYGIKAVNDSVVWACASLPFDGSVAIATNHIIKILRTVNGGKTWRVQDVTTAIGSISIDIESFDSTTAWISTNSLSRTRNKGIYKTIDGGLTWTQKLNHYAGGWNVRFFDKNNGIGVNDNQATYTTDGGETWKTDSAAVALLPNEFGYIITGTNACDIKNDTAWVCVASSTIRSSRVFRTVDKGRTWQGFSTGIPTSPVWNSSSLAFKDGKNGLMIAEEEDDLGNSQMVGIAKTVNGGETWSPLSTLPKDYRTLNSLLVTAIPNSRNAYMIAGVKSNAVLTTYTIDNGATWSPYYQMPLPRVGAMVFSSPKVGWFGNGLTSATNRAAIYKWEGGTIVAGTKETTKNTIEALISPNPATDMIQIDLLNETDNIRWLTLTNSIGQRVLQATGQNKQINIAHLPMGIYLVSVKTEKGDFSMKIMKE